MATPSKPKPKGPTHGVKGSASSIAARQKMAASTALRKRRAAAGYDPRVGPARGPVGQPAKGPLTNKQIQSMNPFERLGSLGDILKKRK